MFPIDLSEVGNERSLSGGMFSNEDELIGENGHDIRELGLYLHCSETELLAGYWFTQ